MTAPARQFVPGTLVRARGREWVVLPQSTGPLLRLRPLSGSEDDTTTIHTGLEPDISDASFPWPSPDQEGNHTTALLLHDALRLSLRRGAGPFRSFGQVDITPRPYQLVPLMMALRQETVRLLIADDVGLGKTIEALLIARELYDRGEIRRLAVLCPPHLVDQWMLEMRTRFHLPAEAVTAGSAARLERGLPVGTSLFDAHAFTVVSLDYIKSDKRRDEFARSCPEAIIVDEAHTCTTGTDTRHQRYQLLKALLDDPRRHAILCTATPHSGDETAFVRLLGLLDPEFATMDEVTDRATAEALRDRLAGHLVQRRRIDIREWHDEKLFPKRETMDLPYRLTGAWEAFLEAVLSYCEEVAERADGARERRLAFWGTLALLRCVTSSPAAAAQALRTRLSVADDLSGEEVLAAQVFDLEPEEGEVADDLEPGADTGDPKVHRLREQAQALAGDGNDPKLATLVDHVAMLLDEGFSPIVFCHYIATARYVGERLRQRFGNVQVEVITGELPPTARAEAVEAMGQHDRRLLVATDCLSEGVNLQDNFDAVVHYDLSWNPTRHEQREGRVDRFGQQRPVVRATLMLGENNPVDGAVLEVILRKAKTIAARLGVPVPLPDDQHRLTEALLKAVLLRRRNRSERAQMALDLFETTEGQAMETAWRDAEERARKTFTKFAQRKLKPEEVQPEFDRAQQALGDPEELARFLRRASARLGAEPAETRDKVLTVEIKEFPEAIKERLSAQGIDAPKLRVVPGDRSVRNAVPVRRSHPLVMTLAEAMLERTLDADGVHGDPAVLGRTGVWPTKGVGKRTVLLLARLRHELTTTREGESSVAMVEEALPVAVIAGESTPLTDAEATALLLAEPTRTLPDAQRRAQLEWLEGQRGALLDVLSDVARARAQALLTDHVRVKKASKALGSWKVRPVEPVDVIGAWVLLPEVAG